MLESLEYEMTAAEPEAVQKLKVLVYTSLFPNSVRPLHGNFILERMRHLSFFADMSVVAPIPYFPRVRFIKRWSEHSLVPRSEKFAGFDIEHPRYVVFPRVGMATHGLSMFAGSFADVRRQCQRTDFDLIDAHYIYPDGLAATMLGAALNKPVVVSARGTDINLFPTFPTIRPLIRSVLKRADGVIAVSQSLKDIMVDLGCPAKKITVIGNGIDRKKFAPKPGGEARRILSLPAARPIVLSVGSLLELKGFHILIDAVARLRTRIPDVLMVVLGEGPYRRQLESQVRALGLEENVMLVGAKPHAQLATWYSAADLFCLASSREGQPNVLLEAMACGLPVIASRVRGTPEVVVSPTLGRLVERTPEAFEQAIESALQQQWDGRLIAAHARQRDWEKVASEILTVYADVLSRHQSNGRTRK
jgi:teichuronic acid biosynthesis glycosyltransferase TuaC